jgi:hypothetical protein
LCPTDCGEKVNRSVGHKSIFAVHVCKQCINIYLLNVDIA